MTDREAFEAWWGKEPEPGDTFWHDHNFPTATMAAIKEECWRSYRAGRLAGREEKDDLRPEYDLKELKPVVWEIELRYKHRGERIHRFTSLGQSNHTNRLLAVEKGKIEAQKWLEASFKPDEIESWEVKARPAKV